MTAFKIEGLRNGEWITLFAPLTRDEALKRYTELCQANPAWHYRIELCA